MDINTTAPNGVGGNAAVVASLNALKSAREVPMKAALDLIEGVAEPQTFGASGNSAGPARVGEHINTKA